MGKTRLWIGSAEHNPTMLYECGFSTPDAIVVLKRNRALECVVPVMEAARARRANPRLVVWTPETLSANGRRPRTAADWAEALLERHKVKQVQVEADFSIGIARRLETKGIDVIIDDKLGCERRQKSPSEIENIMLSQRAMVGAMRRAVQLIKSSDVLESGRLVLKGKTLTSEMVKREIGKYLLERNCTSSNIIVAPGRQGADPHETGHGPIHAGVPIVIDIFGRHQQTGYWGDLTRTVVRGKALPRVADMHKAVRDAHGAALGAVRAGVMGSTVHRAACNALKRRGFETDLTAVPPKGFIHGTGHGVGLEIHEYPSLGAKKARLCAGHVITIEPGWYDSSIGGVRIEDTVVVTKTGYRILAACPYMFEL